MVTTQVLIHKWEPVIIYIMKKHTLETEYCGYDKRTL